MKKIFFAPECFPYVVLFVLIALVFSFIRPLLSYIPLFFLAFVIFFFRDPQREIPSQERIVVAPADGRVIKIEEIYDDKFLKEKAVKISIFLSLFDVHINRSPVSGVVKFIKYVPGKYNAACKENAPKTNERNYIGIENPDIKVLVTQIAGFIARRIVCNKKVGDSIKRGEKFGLIKFGSCTEIILPQNVEITVKKGDKIKGGETIIGRY